MEQMMETIDTNEAKVTKMKEYISKCRAELSATEDMEFAKHMRQYWSASKNSELLKEKIKVLDEETQRILRTKNKTDGIIFVVAVLVALVIQYWELIEKSNQHLLAGAFIAYLIVKEFAYMLETNHNTVRRENWKAQVDYYRHEMNCSGGGNVEYENEYHKAQNNDDTESEEKLYELYLLSVEIAMLHGLKSKMQFNKF
jgi:hypothetical protein